MGTAVIAPRRCPRPAVPPQWGWMVQLYALRSRASWGIGDLRDLADLSAWSGQHGAGFVLCNPLHAASPTVPREPSPYYPSSRRFRDPLMLRVDDVPELGRLGAEARDAVLAAGGSAQVAGGGERIDRDAVAAAKMAALSALHAAGLDRERAASYAGFRLQQGPALEEFATFCAFAEQHGVPYLKWPDALRHPTASGVAAARRALADRVDLHCWLQWLCDEQLAAAQRTALESGMPIGLIHDLAVGVDPGGADAWALQDDLAQHVAVGAPPDAFAPRGQDWAQPPFRPDRLAATGYRAYREVIASVLRHGGGIRVDHALGLFRLYWVPEGAAAADGTYVRYDANALLGILALECERAGALAIAEDLGVVPAGVPETLRDWGMYSSAVFWFERREDNGWRKRTSDYSRNAFTTVTTHDLPTAAGFWTDSALDVQASLDLVPEGRSVEDARAQNEVDREEIRGVLEGEGFLAPGASEADVVSALQAFVARSRSHLVGIALSDAVGDTRQPNVPGTRDEYSNWRLPLARTTDSGEAQPVLLEDLLSEPGVDALARRLTAERRVSTQGDPVQPAG